MEKTIFSNNGGAGIVLINELEDDFIMKKSFTVHGTTIEPDSMTVLDGFFTEPIRYAGMLKNEEICTLCSHTGSISDMFDKYDYYYCFFYISETRLANKYSPKSARDFKWINGKWK